MDASPSGSAAVAAAPPNTKHLRRTVTVSAHAHTQTPGSSTTPPRRHPAAAHSVAPRARMTVAVWHFRGSGDMRDAILDQTCVPVRTGVRERSGRARAGARAPKSSVNMSSSVTRRPPAAPVVQRPRRGHIITPLPRVRRANRPAQTHAQTHKHKHTHTRHAAGALPTAVRRGAPLGRLHRLPAVHEHAPAVHPRSVPYTAGTRQARVYSRARVCAGPRTSARPRRLARRRER